MQVKLAKYAIIQQTLIGIKYISVNFYELHFKTNQNVRFPIGRIVIIDTITHFLVVENQFQLIQNRLMLTSSEFYVLNHTFNYFVHPGVFKQSLLLQLMYLFYVYNGYVTYVATIIIGFIRRKKVKRFILQMETCIRTMHQLNIPMNLSKHFLQQYYIMLFLVFILIAIIIMDYKWLKLLGINPALIFGFFYLEIYPFITWLIPDVTFAFWIRQV
ncbi:uncharacterized protein LOC124946867 [Vespa velutina]|uniref:uncharacterized protein LOC124946867 n=1 Tax=Vespa velutina TaxID=202808 RepID=UPI001FB35298|nr:uncharacterized protein LOC124946867 [Vespa velutina]